MSLHHLGIAHFPVLHRQFSSSMASRFAQEASPDPDTTQDNRDVLIERLNDLVLRLTNAKSLGDGVVSSIHGEVDRIEVLLRGEKNTDPVQVESNQKGGGYEDDIFWRPLTPTRNSRMRLSDTWTKSPRQNTSQGPEMTTSQATEIATAANALASQLTAAIAELHARKEESQHIHDLLVIRCEKAVERILFLEDRVAEVEEDFEANQSELKYLKLQLRALEVQCLQYIPPNGDKELAESIHNWRVDWEDVDRRTKSRKKKCHVPRPGLEHEDSWSTMDES